MVVKWSEVDDFFITENIMKYSDKELADKLGKTEKQVIARIKKLGIDVDGLVLAEKRKQALKGLALGSAGDPNAGVVSMTGTRSLQDDIQKGTSPYGGKGKKAKDGRRAELEKELSEIKEAEEREPIKPGNKLIEKFRVKN